MGNIVLVRHGQARTFEQDSDRLSELGEEQARALARYWIRENARFDEIYSGTLVRQRRTAEIAGECFAQAGLQWPLLTATPEFNEYDSVGILHRLVPALAERDPAFRRLLDEFEARKGAPDRNRYFQHMFEAVTSVWIDGDYQVDGVESWQEFTSRVRGAIRRIAGAGGSGRSVAIFTSGGVVGLAVQTVLGSHEHKALEINWRVRNCSITEFVFGGGRISLDSFNAIPHLDNPRLRSFR